MILQLNDRLRLIKRTIANEHNTTFCRPIKTTEITTTANFNICTKQIKQKHSIALADWQIVTVT